MNPNFILALLAAAGIFFAFSGLVMPRHVRLDQPTPSRGLAALQARLDAAELPVKANEFIVTCLVTAIICAVVAIVLGTPALAMASTMAWPRGRLLGAPKMSSTAEPLTAPQPRVRTRSSGT